MEDEVVLNALNRNVEKHQFPNFQKHPTLIGWCSMNYDSCSRQAPYKDLPSQPIHESQEDIHAEVNQKIEQKLSHLYQDFKDKKYLNRIKKPF